MGHDRRYAIDETKAREELGYAPARDFPQGFAETLNRLLSREDWALIMRTIACCRRVGYKSPQAMPSTAWCSPAGVRSIRRLSPGITLPAASRDSIT